MPAVAAAARSSCARCGVPSTTWNASASRFVASPRHADVLLVTGPVTRNLVEALEQAYAAMPDPKFVVAVGDCAVDGGVFKGSYAVTGGVGTTLPVDLLISGCPPTPERILAGLRALLEANARSQAAVSSR